MGFHRQPQRQALDRDQVRMVVIDFLHEQEIAELLERDPFGIDHDCLDPADHDYISSCGEVVCPHCARIFG